MILCAAMSQWTCVVCDKNGGEDETDEPIVVSYRNDSENLCSLECMLHFAAQKLGAMAADLRKRRDELTAEIEPMERALAGRVFLWPAAGGQQ